MPIEEIRGSVVSRQPVLMCQEVVHFVGEDDLLKFHTLLAQRYDKLLHVRERHVAVVIPLNQ